MWAVKIVSIGVSIIVSIPHCPIDYFIPFCCLDDVLTPSILSIGQCGILMMIDTPMLAILYEKKSLKMFSHVVVVVGELQPI